VTRSSAPLVTGVLVAAIGIAASIAGFIMFQSQVRDEARERLSSTGQELAFITNDIESIAEQQALGLRGLYESSVDVTKEEFDHFADVTGGDLATEFGFAPRIPASMLDEFVAKVRLTQPGYSITNSPDSEGDAISRSFRWPLLYVSKEEGGVGFDAGFELSSNPVIAAAIGAAQSTNFPVVTGFVSLPGDDEEGDVVLVSSVGPPEAPLGVGIVTLQLDELLTERAAQLTGGEVAVRLSEGLADGAVSTGDMWQTSVDIAGRWFGLTLEVVESTSYQIALVPLVVTVSLSIALGWFSYRARKDRDLRVRFAALQETLAEKDRFLATVSHELRTPLTSVVGALEMMGDPEVRMPDHDIEMLIRDARDSARDLERLVDDQLTAARLLAGALTIKRESVNLDELVTRVVASVNLPSQVKIDIHQLGSAMGDRLRVRQIVRNILTNAGRYAYSHIEIAGSTDGDHRVVSIRNDGKPVAPEIADQLFVPFVGDSSGTQPESIGIGLAVSRDLARRMGGDLVYTYEGDYVKFTMTLPTVADGDVATEDSPGAAARYIPSR
jgi:signal transduction histidine kinase